MLKGYLHRTVWQKLPSSWRRMALFTVTSIVAPRPQRAARAAQPIIVVGALRSATGLGESARLCHDALKNSGFQIYGIDIGAALMQPADVDFNFNDGSAIYGRGTIIAHVNSPLMPLAMVRLGRRLIRCKRIIGYWAWELPRTPNDWKYGVPFVHEVWAQSKFTADAITPIADGRPIRIVPHPVAARYTEPFTASSVATAGRPFTVLTMFDMGSSFARKNPCAAITAFREAFGNNPSTQLLIKVQNTSLFVEGRKQLEKAISGTTNITLIEQRMSLSELARLYERVDVLLSLHRSEGFGLSLAEAMLRGIPVVATNWSGNTDFVSVATGIPVGFDLVAAEDPQGTYNYPDLKWAEANVYEAARALSNLRDDPVVLSTLGQAAAEFAWHTWSTSVYANSVCAALGLEDQRCP